MIEFIALVGFVVLFAQLSGISTRLERIERYTIMSKSAAAPAKEMQQSKQKASQPNQEPKTHMQQAAQESQTFVRGQAIPMVVATMPQQAKVAPQPAPRATVPQGPDALDKLMAWLAEDWLMKIGALLILLAMGWFAQHAFTNNWIGEAGRISIGLLIGAGVLAGGYHRSLKYQHQGGVLLALGMAIILSVIFIARERYEMFTALSSLFMMFGTTAFVMLASVRFHNMSLAIGSVALAALAPLLTNAPDSTFIGLFSYLAVVAIASLGLVFFTQWRVLVLENLAIVTLFSIPYILNSSALKGHEVYIAFGFAITFFIVSTIGIVKAPNLSKVDLVTAFSTGMFIFMWTLAAINSDIQPIILSLWALVFAVGSFLTYTATRQLAPFALYGGVAASLIAFATTIEFDGAALMMAYTAEVAIATITTALLTRKRSATSNTAILFIVPLLMSFEHLFSRGWNTSITFDGALAIYFLMAALAGVALFIISFLPLPEDSDPDEVTMPLALLAAFATYLFLLIWMIPHTLFAQSVGTTISLLIYTVLGLTLYTTAKGKYEHTMHRLGQLLLVGVVARLLLIDVWSLDLTGRIITFALVGVALIATAFVKRGKE